MSGLIFMYQPKFLAQAILGTQAYFDLFEYPLTAWELFQWLYWPNLSGKITYQNLVAELNQLVKISRLEFDRGFYFLPGRSAIVETRLRRYLIAEKKYRRLLRICRLFSLIPFVRLIAACNTLAYSNSRRESDLDLFFIVPPGHIWLVRFLAATLAVILRLRPKPGRFQDKICLSFLVTEKNLDLRMIAIDRDIYLKYWINQIIPIYMEEKVYIKFINSNLWLRQHLPNFFPFRINPHRRLSHQRVTKGGKKLIEFMLSGWLGDKIEAGLKRFQLRWLAANLKKLANQGRSVIITDNILKFHDNDRRAEYREQYQKKLQELELG